MIFLGSQVNSSSPTSIKSLSLRYSGPEHLIIVICDGNHLLSALELQSHMMGLVSRPIILRSPLRSSRAVSICGLIVVSWLPVTSRVIRVDLGTGKKKAGGREVRDVFMSRIITSGPAR